MAYHISEQTIRETGKCAYDFECSRKEDWVACAIESALFDSGLVIKDKCEKTHCPYFKKFGYPYFFCYCPSRREIYQRFKI